MTYKIVPKALEDAPDLKLRDYQRDGLRKLRTMLPHDYSLVGDYDLLVAWEDYSEDTYCAGFIGVDDETVALFVEKTKVVEEP